MLNSAWMECLACGGAHEEISLEAVKGQHYDLCPNCNEILPHRILCGGGIFATDIEDDSDIDLETSPPPLDRK